MKIVQIGTGDFFSTYGGGQVYVKNLVDSFIDLKISGDNKFNLEVISFVDNLIQPKRSDYKGIILWEFPSNVSEKLLEDKIKAIKPNIIHAHSLENVICKIGKKLNIRVVITSHHGGLFCPAGASMNYKDEICEININHKNCLPCVLRNTRTGLKFWYPLVKFLPEKIYHKIGKILNKKTFIPFITPIGCASLHINSWKERWNEIIKYSTKVIAPSLRMADIMERNGLAKDKIEIITHGVIPPTMKINFPEIKEDKIKFFYVGRICYVKGIHILLQAFTKINNPNIELHIIGGTGGKSEERYKDKLLKLYNKDKRIKWYGKTSPEKVPETVQNFHVAIAPSIFLEAFGLNISEALCMGKPVLASKCGGGEMQIKEGYNGWLVPPNNLYALRDKINYIIDHPEEPLRFSLNCEAKSMITHSKELLNLYYNLLQSNDNE